MSGLYFWLGAEGESSPSVATILYRASCLTGLSVRDLQGQHKGRKVARPRFGVMWAARQITHHSYPALGRIFGNRDHTSIMHGVREAERLRSADPTFRALTDALVAA